MAIMTTPIFWFTGNTGAGKTTYAKKYAENCKGSVILDGDICREVWPGLGLSKEDRTEQCLRVARLARMLAVQGFVVWVAVICPYRALREEVKKISKCNFIYVNGGAPNTERTPYQVPWDSEVLMILEGNHDY